MNEVSGSDLLKMSYLYVGLNKHIITSDRIDYIQ